MKYAKYLPAEPLSNFVECYFIWQAPAPETKVWVESPPTAFTAIVFNLAERHSVCLDQNSIIKLPPSFISGQSIKNYSLKIDAEIDQVGIVFKPTGLYHLFGLQMFEFTNTRESLHDVLPLDFLHIEEKLFESISDRERIDHLDHTLLKRLKISNAKIDGVDMAAQEVLRSLGNISVATLINNTYMSRRKFERHFLKRVGLSPKYYARIRRYGYICSLMAGQRSVVWDQLLYQVGYYDQSHFIKDFKEFSGKSPNQYLRTNNELAHTIGAIANLE